MAYLCLSIMRPGDLELWPFNLKIAYSWLHGSVGICDIAAAFRWVTNAQDGALCIRQTLCRHVTIGTPMVIFCCFDCLLTVFDDWYTVGTVLVGLWRLVHQWSFCCFDCLLAVFGTPMVIFAVLTVFWLLTMTIGVPVVTGLPRLYQ